MITDYASLKAAINNWSERNYPDTQLAEFVALGESVFRRNLMGYQREIESSLSTDANGRVSLPSDFIGLRYVTQNGNPYRWAISGEGLYISNGANQTFDVVYFGRLPSLSDTNTSNWLLAGAPDAYLFMTQALAKAYDEAWDTAAALEAKALQIMADYNLQNTVAQYSRTGMTLPVQAP